MVAKAEEIKIMEELIAAAKSIISLRYQKGKHAVGAALRTKSGKIYTGISVNSQKVDLCSEWSAIGSAFGEGETEFDMVVAVKRKEDGSFTIFPPCALCRELYITYCPDIKVVLSENEVRTASELLPFAWKKVV